ncbi:MAG TPA: TetR/AcrR family transcriptional regulator [Candidatus Acidoferrum sp.]|nr:TetR/AcrR family transcriptional regulator [Candidatus Acidoferrum sp.]
MGDKRQRTRAGLIEAAKAVIREKGFHAVSLQEVAERAGMSRGAIYGNFRDREELLFAVVETLWEPAVPPLRHGASLREQLRIIGRTVADTAKARRGMAVGAASFQLYALSNPRMRKRLAAENTRIYAHIARSLLEYIPEKELPLPVDIFVKVTHALSDGLTFGHFMAPDQITPEVIVAAFEALAGKK